MNRPCLLLFRCICTSILIFWPEHQASAESALRLSFPEEYGTIEAKTYDEKGKAVGEAEVVISLNENGNTILSGEAGIGGSASATYSVELQPVGSPKTLKPLMQISHSIDESGKSLGTLIINHVKGFASCSPAEADRNKKIKKLDLPTQDVISNVPLSLLFKPLVERKEKEIDFQIVLCRPKPRLIHAKAKVVSSRKNGKGVIEVQYSVDLGNILSRIASPFLPKLSVWFDPDIPNMWIGHRVPLYTQGPTVTVLRSDTLLDRIGSPQKATKGRKF